MCLAPICLQGETANVPYLEGGPTVDGTRESWWDDAETLALEKHMQGDGPSATVRVAWNTDGLALFAEVADATRWRDSGGESWQDDAVEFYLDGNCSGGTAYDGVDDFQIRVMASGGDVFVTGPVGSLTMERSVVETADGYAIEVRLRFPGLPSTTAGGLIGFDVQVGDDADGGIRERKMGWTDGQDMAWAEPVRMGRLNLLAGSGEAEPGATVFAMNCGGGAYTGADGQRWEGSGYYAPRTFPGSMGVGGGIANTDDPNLLASCLLDDSRVMLWKPLPNGCYTVEIGWAAPDSRDEFDVAVQGRLVEDNFVPRDVAGGARRALWRSYPVVITNGQLDVSLFRGREGRPFLNALRVRARAGETGKAVPVSATVSLAAVRSTVLDVGATPFVERFFAVGGGTLSAWRLICPPQRGAFEVDGHRLAAGEVVDASDLASLQFVPESNYVGHDRFQWQASDGSNWSAPSGGLIYVRQAANAVNLGLSPQWNTFQWPLFAYYPEVDASKHGAVTGPDGVTRDGNACGPTARSYLMRYWRHPLVPEGDLGYRDFSGNLVEVAGVQPYVYADMPDTLSWGANESVYASTARLFADNWLASLDLANTGYNVHATVPAYFDFSGEMRKVAKSEFASDAAWIEAIQNELNHGRLVILDGFSDTGGHWWLVHGYRADGQVLVKLNYGNQDGYYPASNMAGYYRELTMLAGLYPERAAEVMLTSPRGGESWEAGQRRQIRWSAPSATKVDLQYSADGGKSWTPIAEGIEATPGSYLWQLPSTVGSKVRVRILDADAPNAYDESAAVNLVAAKAWLTAYYDWADQHSGVPSERRAPEDDPDGNGCPLWMDYLASQGAGGALDRGAWDSSGKRYVLRWPCPSGWTASMIRVESAAEPREGDFRTDAESEVRVQDGKLEIRLAPSATARFFRLRLDY